MFGWFLGFWAFLGDAVLPCTLKILEASSTLSNAISILPVDFWGNGVVDTTNNSLKEAVLDQYA